jgi:hypothetical protein
MAEWLTIASLAIILLAALFWCLRRIDRMWGRPNGSHIAGMIVFIFPHAGISHVPSFKILEFCRKFFDAFVQIVENRIRVTLIAPAIAFDCPWISTSFSGGSSALIRASSFELRYLFGCHFRYY